MLLLLEGTQILSSFKPVCEKLQTVGSSFGKGVKGRDIIQHLNHCSLQLNSCVLDTETRIFAAIKWTSRIGMKVFECSVKNVPMPTNGSQMTDVDSSLREFISSERAGRRDALPDITDLQEPSRDNVVKSSLTVNMTKLTIKSEECIEDTKPVTEAQAPCQVENQETSSQCEDGCENQ